MMNFKRIGGKLLAPVIIVIVVIAAIMLFNTELEHIEDTNGADVFELQKITDENIINRDMGALNVGVKTNKITNNVEISSDKFTGVYEVVYSNLLGKSDFVFELIDFRVNSGNFKMVVVHDDKIVATITPDNYDTFVLEDINGTVSVVIAGESADFSMRMSRFEYEQFSHR